MCLYLTISLAGMLLFSSMTILDGFFYADNSPFRLYVRLETVLIYFISCHCPFNFEHEGRVWGLFISSLMDASIDGRLHSVFVFWFLKWCLEIDLHAIYSPLESFYQNCSSRRPCLITGMNSYMYC